MQPPFQVCSGECFKKLLQRTSVPSFEAAKFAAFLKISSYEEFPLNKSCRTVLHSGESLREANFRCHRAQLLLKRGADKNFMSKWELIFSSERSLPQFRIGLRKVSKQPLTLDQSYTEVTTISLLKQRKGSVGGAYYNGQHACFRTKPRVRFPALLNFFRGS